MLYSQSNHQREAIICAPGWSLQSQLRKIIAQDRVLGIQRAQIPILLIELPINPKSISFEKLADAIWSVAACRHIAPETSQQAIWMRGVQHYWKAKGIALANKIYKLIPDPAQVGGVFTKTLSARALANVKLDVEADLTWYNLLKAGEPNIKAWAEEQKIPYPFTNFEQLFIETLKEGFEISLSEEAFAPSSNSWSRKQERDHHRRWLKFLGDHFDGEPREKEYEAV